MKCGTECANEQKTAAGRLCLAASGAKRLRGRPARACTAELQGLSRTAGTRVARRFPQRWPVSGLLELEMRERGCGSSRSRTAWEPAPDRSRGPACVAAIQARWMWTSLCAMKRATTLRAHAIRVNVVRVEGLGRDAAVWSMLTASAVRTGGCGGGAAKLRPEDLALRPRWAWSPAASPSLRRVDNRVCSPKIGASMQHRDRSREREERRRRGQQDDPGDATVSALNRSASTPRCWRCNAATSTSPSA